MQLHNLFKAVNWNLRISNNKHIHPSPLPPSYFLKNKQWAPSAPRGDHSWLPNLGLERYEKNRGQFLCSSYAVFQKEVNCKINVIIKRNTLSPTLELHKSVGFFFHHSRCQAVNSLWLPCPDRKATVLLPGVRKWGDSAGRVGSSVEVSSTNTQLQRRRQIS